MFHHEEHEGPNNGRRYYFKLQFLHTTIRHNLVFLEIFLYSRFHKFLNLNV